MTQASPQSILRAFWKWLSGFGLATTLLVILGVLTWLATLEMVDRGLLSTLRKYFHWSAWYVVPEINGKPVIPLPGGYWVCALLLVNMICGGLIRARKGWKTSGVLLSHFGIVFMIASGGVAQLFEERGVMFLFEGEKADYAVSLTEPNLEIFEIIDGEPAEEVRVVDFEDLRGMENVDSRVIQLPDLPFDLQLAGWEGNAVVMPGNDPQSVSGWALEGRELRKEGELNSPGCYARVLVEGREPSQPMILAVPPAGSPVSEYAPHPVEVDGRRFGIRMVKRTIPVPYTVELKDAISEYFPNSSRPKSFMSEIYRIEDEAVPVEIKMNEPMRAGGFTFFQRTMSGGPQSSDGPEFSGFEVVNNPADKWPEYSLYVVTLGLLVHFVMKFVMFFRGTSTKRKKA